jgi:hypothetical protein
MTRVIIYLCIFTICLVILKHFLNFKRRPRWVIVDIDSQENFGEETTPPQSKVAIACLMRKPVDLSQWLEHHRQLGVSHFFIRLEDTREQEDFLKTQDDVSLTIAESDKSGNNYETLQTRQIDYVNKSLKDAKPLEIDWMFHIDADELLHGSLNFLDTLDSKYKNVWMENAEAIFNLDKKNADKDQQNKTCFSTTKFLRCSNGAPCRSYVNGKAGGRVADGVGLIGPHNFHYKGRHTGDHVFNIPFNTLHVLHFDSCSFSAWVEKFHHLGKKKNDKIPFTYYNESINAVEQAFNTYKKFLAPSTKDLSKDQIYTVKDL